MIGSIDRHVTGCHVVVIGGGVAGLVAALELRNSGARVTIVESAGRLGGKLRTTPFAGRMVDEGADAFLLRVPWAIDLCRELGTAAELVHPAARTAYVWSHGDLRPLPPQHLGIPVDLDALAASGLVSPQGVERARADLGSPASHPIADATIAEVVSRRVGPEVLERLVDPLIGGINAGDTRHLSLDAVAPQIAAAARDHDHPSLIEACLAQQAKAVGDPSRPIFASPAGGMERLIDWLSEAIDQAPGPKVGRLLGRTVGGIEPGPAGTTPWCLQLDDGTTLDADAVVAAVPAHSLGRLLRAVAPSSAATFDAIDHASVAIVTFAFGLDTLSRPLDRSGYLVPRVEPTEALTACSWSSTKWAHLSPEAGDGTTVIRASAGRAGDAAALDLDDIDLIEALQHDLALTMGVTGAPTEVRVSRWVRGLPQYAPGHLDRIEAAEEGLPPTLAVAGAALRGVGIPACIRSGREAARRVLAARP